MAENIEFRLKVIEDKLGVALDQNAQKAKGLNDVLKVAAGTFVGQAAIKGFDLLGKAVGEATGFLLDSVKAASESEASLKRLEVALAQTGQLTKQNIDSFAELANEIQRTTSVEDDAVISAGALIQTLARLDNEGLKRATSAAVDLSAALGIDLETASQLVGKAANGNITALNRLGIEIKKGVTDTETFANTLSVLESRFSGAAAAQTKTFAGSLAQLKNVYDDVLESVGGVITSNPAVIAAFNTLKNVVVQLGSSLTNLFGGENKNLIDTFFRASFDGVAGFVIALDALQRTSELVINSVLVGIRTLALGVVTPIAGVLELAANIPKIGDAFRGAADTATAEANRLSEALNQNVDKIQGTFSDETFLSKLAGGIAEAKGQYEQFFNEVKNKAPELKNNLTVGAGGDDTTQQDAETIRRQTELNNALLDLDRQYAIEKASLEEANRVAEKERFFIKQEEDIVALQEFELAKSDVQYQAQLDRNSLIANAQEKALADQKALQEREIRNERIRQKTKDEIRRQELDDQRAFFAAATSLSSSKNKELAAIGKAAAIAEIAINTPRAVASSFAFGSRTGGPPLGFAFAAIAATAMAAQAAKVAGVQGFANGGVIGNSNGATMGGDNAIATVRTGELVLNASQQKTLFDAINSGNIGSNQPIVIQIDGREIARAVRNQVQQGYSLA